MIFPLTYYTDIIKSGVGDNSGREGGERKVIVHSIPTDGKMSNENHQIKRMLITW